MSRLSKFLAITIVVVFLLACSFITQPFKDAQDLAKTAESIGSAIPIETLKALPSEIPAGTLEALPSLAPTLEALVTEIPGVGNVMNPQGTPVQTWKDIPIMPQATAGQEFTESNMYSFKATVTAKEVQDFYTEKLTAVGWKQPFGATSQGDTGIMFFQKEGTSLTITIMSSEGSTVVILTLV